MAEIADYFTKIADLDQVGVVVHAVDTKIIYANSFAKDFLSLGDAKGIDASSENWKFIRTDGSELPLEEYPVHKALQIGGKTPKIILGYQNKITKEIKWANCQADVQRDDSGSISTVVVLFLDETENTHNLKALEIQRERLLMSQSAVKMGTWEYDLATQSIYWSPQVFEIYQIDPIDGPPTFEKLLSILQDAERQDLMQAIDDAIAKAKDYELIQELIVNGNEKRYIRAFGKPIKDKLGKIIKLHGTVVDITDETRLNEQIKMLALVAKTTDNAVVVTDADGKIEWVNEGFTRITEYRLDEVVGKKPGSFLQSAETDPKVVDEVRKALKAERSITTEILNFSKSGRKYWLHMNIQPIFDRSRRISRFVAIELDLTARHDAEERILSLNKELATAVETRDKFFSIVSHDLRAPFTGLAGMIEILANHIEDLSKEEIVEFSQKLAENCRLNLNLMDNLLTWARSQRGKLSINKEPANLCKIVENSIATLTDTASIKNIEIRFVPDFDHIGRYDVPMIRSAIQNLVSNAIKFSHMNSHIDVSIEMESNKVVVKVQDYGIGMNAKVLKKLFSAEHKTQDKGTAGEKGTGLGLLLAQEFAEAHRGEISCQSKLGEGTIFKIVFPKENTAVNLDAA